MKNRAASTYCMYNLFVGTPSSARPTFTTLNLASVILPTRDRYCLNCKCAPLWTQTEFLNPWSLHTGVGPLPQVALWQWAMKPGQAGGMREHGTYHCRAADTCTFRVNFCRSLCNISSVVFSVHPISLVSVLDDSSWSSPRRSYCKDNFNSRYVQELRTDGKCGDDNILPARASGEEHNCFQQE